MATDRISALRSFVHAVELGSFSAAAKHLKLSQPAVSHHLRTLEMELGTRLLNRSTRHLILTEAGSRYHAYAVDILEKIDEADRSVRSLNDQMAGRLAIGAPVGFAETVLGDFIISFQKKYPALFLDISLSDQFIDVLTEGLDVSIRMGEIRDERLIVKKTRHRPPASRRITGLSGRNGAARASQRTQKAQISPLCEFSDGPKRDPLQFVR